jgi:hypothetical protein
VTFSPNGVAHQIGLSVNMVNDLATAFLVSRSSNGGDTWSEPITLIRDPSDEPPFLFNDKESITADPNDSRYVYAIWDRLRFPSDRANFNAQHAFSFRGDAIFSRITNGGASWEPARPIFAPREFQSTMAIRSWSGRPGSCRLLHAVPAVREQPPRRQPGRDALHRHWRDVVGAGGGPQDPVRGRV